MKKNRSNRLVGRWCLALTVVGAMLLALGSCDDFSLYSPAIWPRTELEVSGIEDGSIVRKGDFVDFLVSSEEEEGSYRIVINLYEADSNEPLWNLTLRTDPEEATVLAVNEQQQLELPSDLETGQYRIQFRLFTESEIVEDRSFEFFFVEGDYEIRGIESYPPVILPGSTALLRADIAFPDEADPFLRWSQNDLLIAKGPVSDGLDRVFWPAPDEVGVYSIRLDIFPVAPVSATQDYRFASSNFMTSKLYVSHKGSVSLAELSPEESYYTLLHFRGNARDLGVGAREGEFEISLEGTAVGKPELLAVDEGFAFRLDRNSGFRLQRLVLPVQDGALLPFTVHMGLVFDELTPETGILAVETEDESFFLGVRLDERARLQTSSVGQGSYREKRGERGELLNPFILDSKISVSL